MNTTIYLIAHMPLASALRDCALHVFPDSASALVAIDILPQEPPEISLLKARKLFAASASDPALVLTDIFGATPCNVAQKLVQATTSRLITGMNLPMLLRAVTYRAEPLDVLVGRAVVGGTQGVMQVAAAVPQNQQTRPKNDQNLNDHQQ
jgi:mannose PTS system EIIA component